MIVTRASGYPVPRSAVARPLSVFTMDGMRFDEQRHEVFGDVGKC